MLQLRDAEQRDRGFALQASLVKEGPFFFEDQTVHSRKERSARLLQLGASLSGQGLSSHGVHRAAGVAAPGYGGKVQEARGPVQQKVSFFDFACATSKIHSRPRVYSIYVSI